MGDFLAIRLVFGDVTAIGQGDALVDLVAVERVVNGLGPATILTPYERIYAARVMREHGATVADIIARLRLSERTFRAWEVAGWDTSVLVKTPAPAPEPRQLQPCGTRAGYRRHVRHGEPTCPQCRKANTARVIAYKARKRGAAVAA